MVKMARKVAVQPEMPEMPSDSVVLDGATLAALVSSYDSPVYSVLRGLVAVQNKCTDRAVDNAVWQSPDMAQRAVSAVSLTVALQDTADALAVYQSAVKSALVAQARDIAPALAVAEQKFADWQSAMATATAAHTAIGARVAVRTNRRNGESVQTAPGASVDGAGKGRGNSRIERRQYVGKSNTIWRGLSANVLDSSVHVVAHLSSGMTRTVDLPIVTRSDGTVDLAASTLNAIRWYVMVMHCASGAALDPVFWGTSYDSAARPNTWTGKLSDIHGDGALDWRAATIMDLTNPERATALLAHTGALAGVNQYVMVWQGIDAYVPVAPRD